MYKLFICVITFFLVNILCIIAQNSNSENISELNNTYWYSANSNYESKYISFSENNKCLRYCIETLEDRIIDRAVIIWNIDRDALLAFNGNESMKFSVDTENINRGTKCVLYLNLACENLSNTHESIDNITEYLKLLRTINNNDEEIFIIDPGTKLFKISISVENNTSSLLLDMPLDENIVLELSLMHNIATSELYVTMINPSVGKWHIKRTGIETKNLINSINDNYNMIVMQKSIISKRMSLPVQMHPRSVDHFDNLNEGKNITKVNKQNEFARIVNTNDNYDEIIVNDQNEIVNDLTHRINNGKLRFRSLIVDLAPETSLIAHPGTVHPIVFTIINYLPAELYYSFTVSSSNFPIVRIYPNYGWLRTGVTYKVTVHIGIPVVNENVINTVTLHVRHLSNLQNEAKSARIYVQDMNMIMSDYTKPAIYYSFNNNCAGKLSPENCDDNEWSAEITVTDNESGVKNVVSQPEVIQSKMSFIAGMKGSVNFLYRSSCCFPIAKITATDVTGNSYSQEIDVTAWDNLMMGDIAAIVIGTILLLFIIILLILLCIYCVKKRKSEDISFTQRYGSRSNP